MRPKVIADITNEVFYANGNAASIPYLTPGLIDNPAIYPIDEQAMLFAKNPLPPKAERKRTRIWARLKTGL